MTLRTCLIPLLWLLVGLTPVCAATAPRRAVVSVDEALVHSGPGEEFYATSQLASGQVVEIYRHKENGWCAVRPPQGSFSYVRADHVRRTNDAEVVEVVRSGSKTRVGSMLKRAYQVEYITLNRGERLQVLGGPVRLGAEGQTWYRVAPPAGEFRWMRLADLRPEHDAAADSDRSEELTLPEVEHTAQAPMPPARPPAELADATETESKAATVATTSSISLESLSNPRGQMTTEPIPNAAVSPAPATTAPPVALASHETEVREIPEPRAKLTELELALSREVTQELGQWDLATLRQQVVELQAAVSNSTDRRAAQQLLERLDEFGRLQARHQQLAAMDVADPPQPFAPPHPPAVPQPSEAVETTANGHYAGQGWLVPVISSLPNLPRFALTDRQGTIRAFVSARPGLNLRRYERREVGIVGRETRSTDDQAPHLLADRVVVLDRHRR